MPNIVNGVVLSTLRELASSGAVRGYTLNGQVGGYTLTVRYGMTHQVLIAKRGQPRLFAKIETAFEMLRSLGVANVEVIIAGYEAKPRPYRKGRPAALKALSELQRRSIEPTVKAQIPLKIPRRRSTPCASVR